MTLAAERLTRPRAVLPTARRVLLELRRDRRTVLMMVAVPVVLLGLLSWILSNDPHHFNDWGVMVLGILPFLLMFVVTSVATLRERRSGTFELLMTTPVGRPGLLSGYALAFAIAAMAQATISWLAAVGWLGLHFSGPGVASLAVAVLSGLMGMSLGLLVSAFAATEYQAVQLLPAVILPQLLLCGLVAPRTSLPEPLSGLARLLPLTYVVDAMGHLATTAEMSSGLWSDLAYMTLFTAVFVVLGAATLRRRTD